MLRQLLAIAANSFIEGVRQPIYLIMVLVAGVLQVLNTWNTGFSMDYENSAEVSADNKLLFDIGLATVFVCATLLAAFIATAVISREIENKTLLTVVSKPVGRPILVIGKYLGVAAAILLASLTMLLFLLLAIRHGVLSTAADTLDGPVLTFGLAAVALSLALGAWCNFFYGWSFPQTSVLLLFPFTLAAYILVLSLSKDWEWQSLDHDFKPQILVACACLSMAILVLASVATAASTRLGQVMTMVVCGALLIGGMLSNYFIGRHAVKNTPIAMIKTATPSDPSRTTFSQRGDSFEIVFETPSREMLSAPEAFYFGPTPNGFGMVPPRFAPIPRGDEVGTWDTINAPAPALVMTKAENEKITVRNVGEPAVAVSRPPQAGDFVFTRPSEINRPVLWLWAALPNMQHYWLIDAVSQNNPVPASHVFLIVFYGFGQIIAFLAVAVMLLQRRDVG